MKFNDTTDREGSMSDIGQDIDLAQQLLDASRHLLTAESYAERNAKLFRARAPRVPHLVRVALAEEAVSGLKRLEILQERAKRHAAHRRHVNR